MDNSTQTKKAKRRTGGGATGGNKQRHCRPRAPNGCVHKSRATRTSPRARSSNGLEATYGKTQTEYPFCTGPRKDRDQYVLWPAGVVFVVHMVTLTSRVLVVSNPKHWWVLHPDEVFQSLEVAHSEVYGYGFRPYEFLPPHTPGTRMTSLAGRQEAEMGMHSMRSWLYLRLFIAVFHINDYFKYSKSPFIVGKVFHAAVASHLPLMVYFFAASVTRSRDIGHSAAILVSFSEHLTMLGTHTLVNSFLSPVLFAALATLYSLTICDQTNGGDAVTAGVNADNTSSGDSDSTTASRSGSPIKDMNRNLRLSRPTLDPVGKVDTQMMHFNTTLVTSTEDLSAAETQFARENSIWVSVGAVLSLLCYIRVDLILFLVVVGLFMFTDLLLHPVKHVKHVLTLMLGVAAGVLVGGIDDLLSYGHFLISPIQWFKFNILTDLPSVLFGRDSSWAYVEFILNYSMITQIQTILLTGTFLLSMYRFLFIQDTPRGQQLNNCLLRLGLATILLFVIYSLKGHKEIRFMHNIIVLFHICSALSFTILYRWLINIKPGWLHLIKLHSRLLFVLFAINLLLNFPNADDQSNRIWAYKGVWDSNHINQCLDFIRQQPDASGLFSDRSIYETAAYSVLHKDIPIFTLFHHEFMEFDQTVRRLIPSNDYFSVRDMVSVAVTSQISNFITTENSPLLLKTIVAQPNYNYMMLKTTRKLVHIGFDEVFRSGTMRVMRQTRNFSEFAALQRTADAIPIGRNATVLEYEGSRLMTFGLRQLALERLEAATDLDTSRVRAFQLLALIYRDVGRIQDARQITAKCYKHNNKARCLEMHPNDYSI